MPGPGGFGPAGRGPGGPGGRGPGGPGGFGPYDTDDDFDDPDGPDGERRGRLGARPGTRRGDAKSRSKKARRRNILISAFAILIMLTGAGVVGGTYFVNGVVTRRSSTSRIDHAVLQRRQDGAGPTGREHPVSAEV
jgi:hypothetical protein